MQQLSPEMFWLSLTAGMTALMWIPYIFNRLIEQGPTTALRDPSGNTATSVSWAARMMKAHANAVENLVVFAPLALVVQITAANNAVTAMACMVYFLARLAHFVIFSLGIPYLKVLMFGIGVACQMTLLCQVLFRS